MKIQPFGQFLDILTGQCFNCHFGGGGGMKDPTKPSAPVTESAFEVSDAKRRRLKTGAARAGLASTIYAGGNPGLTTGKQLLSGTSS